MSTQDIFERLLADLSKVQHVVRQDRLPSLPYSAVAYISANHDFIAFVIAQVYAKTNRTEREELERDHRELHPSAVGDGFGELAAGVVTDAWQAIEAKRKHGIILELTDDDLDVLLRVLKYANYIVLDQHDFKLECTPIEEYGLKPRFGNFLDLTEDDWRKVPWHLSDMVFAEQRMVIESKCATLGLDLANRTVSDGSDIYSIDSWTDQLAALLELSVECDWAAVTQVAQYEHDRYLNTLVGRVAFRFSQVIGAFRESLEKWARRRGLKDPFHTAARDSVSLVDRYEKLLPRIREIQPRPALYESIKRLRETANSMTQHYGDVVMRDKNVLEGQGVLAPGGDVHDINFNQIWDQSQQEIQLPQLAEELARLRKAMRSLGDKADKDVDVEVGYVASAEKEARKGDGPGTLQYLSKAGKWAWDVATEIGVELAAAALGRALGLPAS